MRATLRGTPDTASKAVLTMPPPGRRVLLGLPQRGAPADRPFYCDQDDPRPNDPADDKAEAGRHARSSKTAGSQKTPRKSRTNATTITRTGGEHHRRGLYLERRRGCRSTAKARPRRRFGLANRRL